jgi:nucleotidyltransferase substrate binding protein (TIGR01987 family)
MQDPARLDERKADFLNSVKRLHEACLEPDNAFIRDSVIQRFEFCWELAWKLLQCYLLSLGIETKNPRDTWQEAVKAGLIENIVAWTELQRMRNLTSHTYDEKLAKEVYLHVKTQGILLFEALVQKVMSWS